MYLLSGLDQFQVPSTPSTTEDIVRVAAFNGTIHGDGIASLTVALLNHFPGMTWDDLVFIEEAETGAIISSLCLIPWSMCVGSTVLQVGELGIVGTADAYRRRGLVRVQMRYFIHIGRDRMRRHASNDCPWSVLQCFGKVVDLNLLFAG